MRNGLIGGKKIIVLGEKENKARRRRQAEKSRTTLVKPGRSESIS